MPYYRIRHRTTYHYTQPVRLGPHRLLLRPRDSHDLRLLETALTITPTPQSTRWLHDVFGNSIAVVSFDGEAETLDIDSQLLIEHMGWSKPELVLEDYARTWPFNYEQSEAADLAPLVARHDEDRDGRIDAWAMEMVEGRGSMGTQRLLVRMMQRIHEELPYRSRPEMGTQTSLETLADGGSCRDLAMFMMEAARSLGFAARFVSGYLYDPALDDGPDQGLLGAGATHAWPSIYLPGAGWVEFDPTNRLYGGAYLIRVATARAPSQAIPVSGSYWGPSEVAMPLEVEVSVTREG
ncbi:MAG: transglutaminase N-terminal domain-containing protein [Geminicoccaceae bacterium]